MKRIKRFWEKRSDYEKIAIWLALGYFVFCLGYFFNQMYNKARCALCTQDLRNGEHYILDVRTGELLSIGTYVEKESSVFWFSGIGRMPQEVSITDGVGYMRFPRQAPATARYCDGHTSRLDTNFLLLSPSKSALVCCAVQNGQNLSPDGRIIVKCLNETFDCWEMAIQLDENTPVTSS